MLGLTSILWGAGLGIALGVVAALHRGKALDYAGGPGRILADLLGEDGGALWAEALRAGGGYGSGPRLLRAPQYVAGSFLQMLNCDYPNRAKRLFLEGKRSESL